MFPCYNASQTYAQIAPNAFGHCAGGVFSCPKGGSDVSQLNEKRQRFVELYLVYLDATRAAKEAGYSERTANRIGHQLLQDPRVQAALREAMDKRSQRTAIDQDRVLMELGRMGFANMLDYVQVQEDGTARINLRALNRDTAAAIQEVTVEQVG